MLGILLAIVLGLWLIFSTNREANALTEATLVILLAFILSCLVDRSLPEFSWVLMLSYFFQWIYVFLVIWLLDIICFSILSVMIYAGATSIGYYFFYHYSLQWAQFMIG